MTTTTKYFGDWSDHAGMVAGFTGTRWGYDEEAKPPEGIATDDEVLFAGYRSQDYQGCALVLFERDGKLYEAHGSHCSCYGLEGQWEPEETTWAAIAMRPEYANRGEEREYGYGWDYDFTHEGAAALRALVASHV